MNWRKLILGGLLLPLRLYFQPARFRTETESLFPEVRRTSLWKERSSLHKNDLLKRARMVFGQLLLASLWPLAFVFILESFGYRVIRVGAALGVVLAVISGMALVVFVNISLGIEIIVRMSLWVGLTGLSFNPPTRGILLSVTTGIAGALLHGPPTTRSGRQAFEWSMSFVMGLAVGLMSGWIGWCTYVAVHTHLIFYPLQALLTMCAGQLNRFGLFELKQKFWRVMPIRWDEAILLPLPSLVEYLKQLYDDDDDAEFGLDAIGEVAKHPYRWPAAYQALSEISLDEATKVESLATLANYKTAQDWLDERTGWGDAMQSDLRQLRAISDEAASALLADSSANKLRRLADAQKLFESLRGSTGQMRAIVIQWEALIVAEQQATQAAQAGNEPITQVYFKGGKPIQPDDLNEADNPFKGRVALAQQLEEALGQEQRATLLLLGTRRVGKSSLLLHLPRRLGHAIIPAFINLQDEKFSGKDEANFFIGFADAIGEQVRRNVERYQRDPLRVPLLERESLRRDPYPAFGKWLDAVEHALGKRTLLLCLDEFEHLEESIAAGRMDTRVLDLLRNIIQYRRRITVLLSGVHYLDELPPHWASALVNTQILSISFLDEPDARELIVQPVRSFPPDIYAAETVERILALTHCQPYLIQLLCGLLVEHCNRLILKGERPRPPAVSIPPTDLDEVIPLALQQGEAYFSDLWKSRSGSDLARRVLERLAFNESATSEELKAMANDDEGLRAALDGLRRREIVTREAEGNSYRYRITVPLVAHYVRKVREAI